MLSRRVAKINTVFPSYLALGTLPGSAFSRELKREILALEEIDDYGRAWSEEHYYGGYSSYSSMDRLQETSPNFAELEKKLAPHVRAFVRKLRWDLRGRPLRMTTAWANRMSQGCHHTMHNHPGSVLSGVYYVDTPKNSSPLKIEDPRQSLMMAAPPRAASAPPAEQNYLLIPAKAGQFVLFESWMRHEVTPHRGAKDRFSISFNYEWL